MIEERLKTKTLPISIPLGAEENFKGLIDLVEQRAWVFDMEPGNPPQEVAIPPEEQGNVEKYRKMLIDRLAEEDEDIMDAYFDGEEIAIVRLKAAMRRVTLANKAVPILAGASFRNVAMEHLLDCINDYLPSPLDMPPIKAIDPDSGAEVARLADDEEPFAALAFKVVSDPFVGRLVYFRVYAGKVKVGDGILNVTHNRKERVGRLLRMHANMREEIEDAYTGDIVATLGLKNTFTGDTLCDPEAKILLESISFPDPVISVAIEPRSRADQDRLVDALGRIAEEDPTFKVTYNEETGQTIISGMGELHLEVIVSRLISEFKVGAKVGKPQVAYRETITASVKAEGRFIRQSGGHGQYGDVFVELTPLERGKGFEFEERLKGATIPRNFIPPVEEGIREALASGVVAGYPIVDLKATLYDGSYHDVDSSDMAFKLAGSLALKNGVARANPVLLEPMMKLQVVTPEEFLGDVIGDLNARRGRIEAIETNGDVSSIRAIVPLAETFGYATTIRSLTQGRGTHTMEFHAYQEVTPELADEITEKATGGTRPR
jgi:elongation factor G